MALKRLSIISSNSEIEDTRPLSPDQGCTIKSFSSTSTLDSLVAESNSNTVPPLPLMIRVHSLQLQRLSSGPLSSGWGVTLRGTVTELSKGNKIYTCHIETLQENGIAKAAGLNEGDQILCVNGLHVKQLEHGEIIKMFQVNEKLALDILPAQFKLCSHIRIIKSNQLALESCYCQKRNVNLGKDSTIEVDLSSLLCIKSLSMNHCLLENFDNLKGLEDLSTLESLSLAHNLLSASVLHKLCNLNKLKKLDLSRNILTSIPETVCTLTSLEILILVDNNITELHHDFHNLVNLQILCLDGNLLKEVDSVLSQMESIQILTISNNGLECESEAVKMNEFLITCIEGNPFCNYNSGIITRNHPSLRRTLSIRGQLFAPKKRHSLEWDTRATELKLQECEHVGTQ